MLGHANPCHPNSENVRLGLAFILLLIFIPPSTHQLIHYSGLHTHVVRAMPHPGPDFDTLVLIRAEELPGV